MTISEAYTTIDNCNHFIATTKKFLMSRLKRLIGADKEDCLWLYWKDMKVIPSGYNVTQSWQAERVEGNHWVEKLKQIVDQFEENFN